MCSKSDWKKIAVFGLAFLFGLLAVSILQIVTSCSITQEIQRNSGKKAITKIQEKSLSDVVRREQESGFCKGHSGERKILSFNVPEFTETENKISKRLRIVYKPRAKYTAEARQNHTEGEITLRVAFLASGDIGSVTPVSEKLPDGLTEQAIEAARQIKFEPQIVNGRKQTLIKSVKYSFEIY